MSPGRSVKSSAWLRARAPVTFPVICNVTLSSLLAITSHFWTKCIPDARRSGPFSISYRHKKEIDEFINDSGTALPYPADNVKSLLAHLRITDACSNYVLFIFIAKLGTQDQFTHLLISFDISYTIFQMQFALMQFCNSCHVCSNNWYIRVLFHHKIYFIELAVHISLHFILHFRWV